MQRTVATKMSQPVRQAVLRSIMEPASRRMMGTFHPTIRAMAPFQPTRRLMRQPKEEQGAHTISQRIRRLKNIPPELIPLGLVVLVALVFAVYSMIKKLFTDKTLRLHRSGGKH